MKMIYSKMDNVKVIEKLIAATGRGIHSYDTLCNFSKYSFMEEQEYRKLRTYLPRQPIVNQRPWLIAGLLLAFIVLLLAVYGYLSYINKASSHDSQEKVTSKGKR